MAGRNDEERLRRRDHFRAAPDLRVIADAGHEAQLSGRFVAGGEQHDVPRERVHATDLGIHFMLVSIAFGN